MTDSSDYLNSKSSSPEVGQNLSLIEAEEKLELSENPFTATVLTSRLSTTCSYCLITVDQPSSRLLRCSKCKFVYYCRGQCQNDDWSHHKRECQRIRRLHAFMNEQGIIRIPDGLLNDRHSTMVHQFPDESLRLIARMMDMWNWSSSTFVSGGRTLDMLESRVEEIKDSTTNALAMEQLEVFYRLYEFFLTGDGTGGRPDYDKQKLLRIYGICRSNATCIKDGWGAEAIGSGIYVNLRRLQHSCRPNACLIFQGRQARILMFANATSADNRRLQPPAVTSYDQIRISYVERMMTKSERQRLLKEIYFIDCHCDCCESDQERNDGMEGLRCDAPDGCDGIVVWQDADVQGYYGCRLCGKKFEDDQNTKMIMDLTKSILDVPATRLRSIMEPQWAKDVYANLACMQMPTLHPYNVYGIRTIRGSYETACRLGNWADAAAYGDETLDGYRRYLNEDSDPEFATLAFNVAKAHINNKDWESASKLLEKSMRCYEYAYGCDSFQYREINGFLDLCKSTISGLKDSKKND